MNDPNVVDLFSKPQYGGDLPYFSGKQYGSGWLETIGRFAFSIIKKIGSRLSSVFGKTASDYIGGKSGITDSLKRHATEEIEDVFRNDDDDDDDDNETVPKSKLKKKYINKRRKMSRGTIFK